MSDRGLCVVVLALHAKQAAVAAGGAEQALWSTRSLRTLGAATRVRSLRRDWPGHRCAPGTSRALISPASFQPSARSHVVGLRTNSGSYVSRIGHIHAWSCSSFQSGDEIALEKGSTSHGLGKPCWSSLWWRQLEST